MASFSAKISNVFRNLLSDAVPRDPRPEHVTIDDVTGGNHNATEEPEEIFIGAENENAEQKRNVFGTKKKAKPDKSKSKKGSSNKHNECGPGNNVNTQATGYVINIIDSNKVRCGNDFVYYLGPTNTTKAKHEADDSNDEEDVEKTNLIVLLMEATITPEHEHIDYISKNLGRKWHSFFRRLGYTKGRIETFEIDESRNGVSEARYKLLLDWVRNDDIGTLGHLATQLWEEGERHVVKELSIIYSKNKK